MEPITAILGSIIGAVARLLPEVFKLFMLKKDQDHEYRMTQLQLEIDKTRAQFEIDKVHANEALEAIRGEMQAYIEAVKGQSQLTGVKWVDAINQTVRPFITYWWMILLTVNKCVVILSAKNLEEMKTLIWTPDDQAILAMILGFFFVNRTMKYMKNV